MALEIADSLRAGAEPPPAPPRAPAEGGGGGVDALAALLRGAAHAARALDARRAAAERRAGAALELVGQLQAVVGSQRDRLRLDRYDAQDFEELESAMKADGLWLL